MDDLSKANTQNSELKKNIDKLIVDADKLFKQEKYMDAKALYEKVLSLESDNKLALSKIAECDKLEIAKGVSQGDTEYKKLVSAADKKFNEKNYLKAKEYYERAVGIRNTDPYPKQKLCSIKVYCVLLELQFHLSLQHPLLQTSSIRRCQYGAALLMQTFMHGKISQVHLADPI